MPHSCAVASPNLISSHPSSTNQVSSTSILPSPVVNNHPMITRAKHGIYKPKAFLTNIFDLEPKTIQEALAHPHWNKAVHEEYTAWSKIRHGLSLICHLIVVL